jgi:Anti-sigma-D factor RsdA to sigma factor binding region
MPDFGRWTANGGDPSLNEINRTDRFLDALAAEQPVYSTDPGEAELAHVLAGWRDDVRRPPARMVATQRDAVAALNRGVASRQRTRLSMAVVGSVAAALLCLGGFGAVVYGAGPGDALYGLRTMLFGEQTITRDDQVVLAAQTQLAEVQQLIDQGQWEAAQDKLQTVTTTVQTVNDVERKQELVTQWQELSVKVETRDPNATVPPGAPPPTLPDLPAVVEPGTTTTSSETTTSPAETTTSPAETTTSPAETTTSPAETTTSPPAEPPPQTSPTSSPTPPPTTTTTTVAPTTTTTEPTQPTTTTTTVGAAPHEPAADEGGSSAVEAPTSPPERPRPRAPQGRDTVTAPAITTTILQLPLPDFGSRGDDE